MIISYTIELLLTLANNSILLTKFCNGKFNYKNLILYGIFLFVPAYILFCYYNQYLLLTVYSLFSYSLITIDNVSKKKIICISTFIQGFSLFTTAVTLLVVNCFYSNEFVKYMISIIINAIFTFVLLFVKKEKLQINELIDFIPFSSKIYMIISIYAVSLISIVLAYVPADNSFKRWYMLFEILLLIVIVIFIVAYPLLISSVISKQYYKRKSEIIGKHIEQQVKYYKQLSENSMKLRQFKHDYKNQIIALQAYLDNNQIEKAKEYINKSSEFLSDKTAFKTGNYILDSLLSEKTSISEADNIKIEFEGTFPSEGIEPTDVCVIFGNAIDNAIEACKKLDSQTNIKPIKIRSVLHNSLLHIVIKNPVAEVPIIYDNSIKTTKANSEEHGIGLYSIKKTTEKYYGDFNIQCVNNVFLLSISLSLSTNDHKI